MVSLQEMEKRRKKAYKASKIPYVLIGIFIVFLIVGNILIEMRKRSPELFTNLAHSQEGESPVLRGIATLIVLGLGVLIVKAPKLRGKTKKFNEYYARNCLVEQMEQFDVETVGSVNGFNRQALSELFSYSQIETLVHLTGKWRTIPFQLGEVRLSRSEKNYTTSDHHRQSRGIHTGMFFKIAVPVDKQIRVLIKSKQLGEAFKPIQTKSLMEGLKKAVKKEYEKPEDYGIAAFAEVFWVLGDEKELTFLTEEVQTCLVKLGTCYPKIRLLIYQGELQLSISDREVLVPKNTELTDTYLQHQAEFFQVLHQFLEVLEKSLA